MSSTFRRSLGLLLLLMPQLGLDMMKYERHENARLLTNKHLSEHYLSLICAGSIFQVAYFHIRDVENIAGWR